MPGRSPQALWETALGQLELQVTRPNFDTWFRHTKGLRLEDDLLVVGAPTDFAVEWLRSRMESLVSRTISRLLGAPTSISFEVLGVQSTEEIPDSTAASTLATPLTSLDPRLTLDSFTVGKSNRLAHRAAQRIAAGESSYNVLVLFGAPGLGKTHLVQAIGHQAAQAGKQVVALTGESFVDKFAKSVRAGRPHTFNELFLTCDIFLLDDLSFVTTRRASLEQLFHVFNSLHARGASLIFTMESHPSSLAGLPARLRSRLQAGLCVELAAPVGTERLALLRAKSAALNHSLSNATLQFIADQPYTSVRELEGAINRVVAFADLSTEPLSLELVAQALHPLSPPAHNPSNDEILEAVCQHFHLNSQQLAGPSRARDVTYARHIAMYLLRLKSSLPLAQIGQRLGQRDHSTVLKGVQRIKQELTTLPQTRTDIEQLESALLASRSA